MLKAARNDTIYGCLNPQLELGCSMTNEAAGLRVKITRKAIASSFIHVNPHQSMTYIVVLGLNWWFYKNIKPVTKATKCITVAMFSQIRRASRHLKLRWLPSGFAAVRQCTDWQAPTYRLHGGAQTIIASSCNLGLKRWGKWAWTSTIMTQIRKEKPWKTKSIQNYAKIFVSIRAWHCKRGQSATKCDVVSVMSTHSGHIFITMCHLSSQDIQRPRHWRPIFNNL